MNPTVKAALLLKYLGPRWAFFRLRYALRRKSGGLVRRSPRIGWSRISAAVNVPGPRLFALSSAIGEACVVEADEILNDRFRLFSFHRVDAGAHPDWSRNSLTGERAPADRHWSELGDFAFGDIKGIWELSRFPWAFALGRAFARTRDERYAERFWSLFEDWLDANPPNTGANWMCGQEATFRLMAAKFARDACADAAATTEARVARFHSFVFATGQRIAANLDYALSQSNNHGVSEAIGLITAGILLPSEPESGGWRRRGEAALQSQLAELLYRDGAFSQHSANYHRVLLHDLTWAAVVLRATGEPPPAWLGDAGRRAVAFLEVLMNPDTGRVPLYGANDGANVLPLADCDYLDFRPVMHAAHVIFHGVRGLSPGPWDEAGRWLTSGIEGRKEDGSQTTEARHHFPNGGVLVWRHCDMKLFLRCPTKFRHRPAQADLLHVDLEWRGQPIAIDAGTYSYNAPGPFTGALKEAALHNTVTFDGGEPMEKAGRFLFLPWPTGQAGWEGDIFAASHDGWSRICARHWRRVRATADGFEVEDCLSGTGRLHARLHWLIADQEYVMDGANSTLRLSTAAGPVTMKWSAPAGFSVTLVRAAPESNRGWWSPYYGHVTPAISLAIEFDFEGEVRVTTNFAPA